MKKWVSALLLSISLITGISVPNSEVSAATHQTYVQIISIKNPAARNSTETLTAKVSPNSTAYIAVHYKSGLSKAQGLGPKRSNSKGYVSWSWHVGGNTTIGTVPVTVTCNGHSASTQFRVVH